MFFAFFPDEVDEAFVFGGEFFEEELARVEEHLLLLIHLLYLLTFILNHPLYYLTISHTIKSI